MQQDHEEAEKKKMERVFSEYVQRRVKMDSKIVSLIPSLLSLSLEQNALRE